jgi:uncharacterized membrane protein
MNSAHVHLLLNHIPVLGIAFGFLLLAWAMVKKSDQLTKAGFGLFVIAALVTLPVYLTGEPAEEIVGHLPGVAQSIIEQHERAGLFSLIASGVTGVAALTGLILSRGAKSVPRWMAVSVLALSLVTVGVIGWTANLGGQIRHPEIRAGFTPAAETEQTEAEGKQKTRGKEENEHDEK